MKNFSPKAIIIALLLVLFPLLLATDNRKQPNYDNENKQNDNLTIILAGDIMMDRGVEKKVLDKFNGNYAELFSQISEITKSADISFANMEGPVSDKGEDAGGKYSFRMSPDILDAIEYAGFDVLSLANNHIFDYGTEALCDTVKNFRERGIKTVGAGCDRDEAEAPAIFNIKGTAIAFLAFSEFHRWGKAGEDYPGSTDASIENIRRKISEAEKNNDLVLVSMHWGKEYQNTSSRAQQNLSEELIDTGADIVIGHHPHVDQEIRKYKHGFIIYSLGNFIFDQSWSQNTMESYLVKAHIVNKKIKSLEIIPYTIDDDFRPIPYTYPGDKNPETPESS